MILESGPALALPIGLPLLAGLVLPMVRRHPMPWLVAGFAFATLGSVIVLAVTVGHIGPVIHALGGWEPPLGIALRADGMAVLMLLLTAVVTTVCSLYAMWQGHETALGNRWFWGVWFFLWASLNALFLSGDVFNLYITLELLTVAGVILVTFGKPPAALVAGMRYLIAGLFGSMAYLLGVALIYGQAGTLDLALLTTAPPEGPAGVAAAALMTVGLLLKTALVPLHAWLPYAHASAPSPVSAVLSGLVVKGSFFILLILWTGPFSALFHQAAWQLMGILGAVAILWGSVQALRQERLKMLIAYSTVAQIGYLFLVPPLLMAGAAAIAWQAAQMQIMAHALAKAGFFLAAGNLLMATGRDDLAAIPGVRNSLKMSLLAMALSGVTLIGLPPSGGFAGKWLLLAASLETGQWWWIVVLGIGTALSAGYVFRAVAPTLRQDVDAEPHQPIDVRLQVLPLTLAVASILLGVFAVHPLDFGSIGGAFGAIPVGTGE